MKLDVTLSSPNRCIIWYHFRRHKMEDGSLSICEESRVKAIVDNVVKSLTSWYSVVNTLGLGQDDKIKWEEGLQAEFEALGNECCLLAEEKRQVLNEKIARLLEEAEKLCKQLNIKMPRFAPSNQGMYYDEKCLIEKVKSWQDEITERTTEVNNLKARRDEISKILGRRSFYIKESPLPSKEELHVYLKNIEELEIEKESRIVRFRDLREKIALLSEEIQYKPRLDFERDIISGENLFDFEASDENMQRVSQFHMDLEMMRENIEEELNKYRERLDNLWRVLEEDVKDCNDFIGAHVGINYTTLAAFKSEVKRCEEIRKTNLGKFIEKLRGDLTTLWNEIGMSQAKRDEFSSYLSDNMYTEDLLTLHDIQIERAKKYQLENQAIFDLLKERDVLYQRLRDMEARANAPERFKNRGGKLLKEEKERKVVTKKIPAIEDKLLNLAIMYEEEHGDKFTYCEETIEDLIAKSRENLEQERKELLSARKQKRDITMSNSKTTFYKSPSRVLLTNNFLTPRPNNLRTPMRTPKTAPVRRVLTARKSITKAKQRVSTDKKRRSAAMRAKIQASRMEPNENDVDYPKFMNTISTSKHARSTAIMNIPDIQVQAPTPRANRLQPVVSKIKLLF